MESFLHGTSAHAQEPSNPSTTNSIHSAATTTQILNSSCNLPDTDEENALGSVIQHTFLQNTSNFLQPLENCIENLSLKTSSHSPDTLFQVENHNSFFSKLSQSSVIIEKFTSADCQLLQRKLPCVFVDQETIVNSSALNCCLCQKIVCFPMILSCGHSACKECCSENEEKMMVQNLICL